MDKQQVIDIANDMAFMACIWIDDEGNEINDLVEFANRIAKAKAEELAAALLKGPVNDTAASIAIWIREQ